MWCGVVALTAKEATATVVVVIVVMTSGDMVEAMVWCVILVNIILIIILIMVVVGIGLVVVTRKLYALYPKMTHFWVTMVKNELKPYNLYRF